MEETRQQQQQQEDEEREDEEDNIVKRFSDKEWPRQWYLNRGGDLDMNVEEAWDLGYSGKGVTVTILDDGVEWNHPDLSANYKEEASYDINANDKDPFPRSEQLIDKNTFLNCDLSGDSGTICSTPTSTGLGVLAKSPPRQTTPSARWASPSMLGLVSQSESVLLSHWSRSNEDFL